jgi:hypothetical protein
MNARMPISTHGHPSFLLDLATFVTVAEKNLIVLDNLSNSGLAVRWL